MLIALNPGRYTSDQSIDRRPAMRLAGYIQACTPFSHWEVKVKTVHVFDFTRCAVTWQLKHRSEGNQRLPDQSFLREAHA